jgi:hypothetical protein
MDFRHADNPKPFYKYKKKQKHEMSEIENTPEPALSDNFELALQDIRWIGEKIREIELCNGCSYYAGKPLRCSIQYRCKDHSALQAIRIVTKKYMTDKEKGK